MADDDDDDDGLRARVLSLSRSDVRSVLLLGKKWRREHKWQWIAAEVVELSWLYLATGVGGVAYNAMLPGLLAQAKASADLILLGLLVLALVVQLWMLFVLLPMATWRVMKRVWALLD